MKYKDWICEWLDDYVKPTVKEKTYLNYSVMLRTHILPAIGELELDELTLPVLQSFVFNMSDHGNAKTGGGLSPSTVSMIEGVVERSLNFAVEIGLIERHYAAHVRCPRVNGKKVDAPPKEMELLFHLASTPNRVYTRNQLLDEVWGFDYFGDSRTVDVHIKRLREKVEGVSDQWALKTVWGVGYKFELLGKPK